LSPPVGAAAIPIVWLPPPPAAVAPPPPAEVESKRTHQWQWRGSSWQCIACRQRCKNEQARTRREKEHCPGFCAQHSDLIVNPKGHLPYFFGFIDETISSSIILCKKCGCYSEGARASGFQGVCPEEPPNHGRKLQRQRALEGKHPKGAANSSVILQEPIPLAQVASELAASDTANPNEGQPSSD